MKYTKKKETVCPCGKKIENKNIKYCSRRCKYDYAEGSGKFLKNKHQHKCRCGNNFTTYNTKRLFCSRICWSKYHIPWNKGKTKHTDVRVNAYAKHLEGHAMFCDIDILRLSNIGHKRWVGKKHKLDSRIKMSLAHSKEREFKGFKKSARARNMSSIEYREWKKAVFNRDKKTCQECYKIDVPIEAHHIKPYSKFPELRFAISNGITLCVDCHCKIDPIRGQIRKALESKKSVGEIYAL